MFYENLRINMPRDLSCCLLFFTIFGLGKKNSPYFPFHNVGRSVSTPFGGSLHLCGAWWHIGRVDAFQPEDREFESRSIRHVGTLGKSFTYSCLLGFSMRTPIQCRLVLLGAFLKGSGCDKCYRNG